MIKNSVKHPVYRVLILATIIICLLEAFTKGWASFALLPLTIVVLPIYAFFEYMSLKQDSGPYVQWIKITSLLLTLFVLMFFVGTVGFGDTDEVLLFGFYKSSDSSQITQLSSYAAQASYYLAPATLVLLIGLLVANDKKT